MHSGVSFWPTSWAIQSFALRPMKDPPTAPLCSGESPAGVFKDVDEARSGIELRADMCEPQTDSTRRYEDYYAAYRALYPATWSTMHMLAQLSMMASEDS